MPPRADETTAQIVSAAQRDAKNGAPIADGELANYSPDQLRHADDALGSRDTDASWRRRLQRHIEWRDQRKGWVMWCRDHFGHFVLAVLVIIVAAVVSSMIGL